MRDFLQEYFIIISEFNGATGTARSIKLLPTRRALENLLEDLPFTSRLSAEVNKYLFKNFSQPQASTQ